MKSLVPDHNTIANFRKHNPKDIARVFRATVNLALHFELIGGSLVAGDSTILRAQNSKKINFNPAKIQCTSLILITNLWNKTRFLLKKMAMNPLKKRLLPKFENTSCKKTNT